MTQFYSKARVTAVLKQFERLRREVAGFYAVQIREDAYSRRESALNEAIREDEALKESLRQTTERVLNIRINNHFLFNTLNAIGSLAVREDAFDTYEALLILSKLFRYTLKADDHAVRLRDEIAYVEDYLSLQKLRFVGDFCTDISIPAELADFEMPFQCLQPIIENAFIHGFRERGKPFSIRIAAKPMRFGALIRISDSGVGMGRAALRALHEAIGAGYGGSNPNGLAMVNEKFRLFYGNRFSMRFKSAPGDGFAVEISIGRGPEA
ncbi:MAG: histidine kinase [Clostridiales Family XIII bacterium]|jgi:sensor histidine kinase YesM|nr:histidine kinase [Clostridiales Family XIII bacterium]